MEVVVECWREVVGCLIPQVGYVPFYHILLHIDG